MTKFLELLLKYVGFPLLMKAVEAVTGYVREVWDRMQKDRQIEQDQESKTEEVENAKTPEEIRAAHRNNNRF